MEEKLKFKKIWEFFSDQHFLKHLVEGKVKFMKSRELYPVSVALLLRHMPNLRRIDHTSSISVCSAIKLLHQIPKANHIGNNHTDIPEDSKDQTHLRLPSPLMITNSPFSGKLILYI
jgi:hypothetical protein